MIWHAKENQAEIAIVIWICIIFFSYSNIIKKDFDMNKFILWSNISASAAH